MKERVAVFRWQAANVGLNTLVLPQFAPGCRRPGFACL